MARHLDIEARQAAERLGATLDRIARTGAVMPEGYDREDLYAERMSALDRVRPRRA